MSTSILRLTAFALAVLPAGDDPLAIVPDVELQPLAAATERLLTALDYIGSPLAPEDAGALGRILADPPPDAVAAIQRVLDDYCVAGVHVNPEARVKVSAGPARRQLVRHGWRSFLVKVHNEAGVTAPLGLSSPQAAPVYRMSDNSPAPATVVTPGNVTARWLDAAVYRGQPLGAELSGLELEYCVVQLYSRDAGKREATLAFDVGQGTQDIGFRRRGAAASSTARRRSRSCSRCSTWTARRRRRPSTSAMRQGLGLSDSGQAAGSRLLLPAADLPRQR